MAAVLIILAVIAPIAWLASEFQSRAWLRIVLGLAAFVGVFFSGALWDFLNQIDSNSYFGRANQNLIEATIKALDEGRAGQVLEHLRELHQSYEPTYENRANYEELVEAYSQGLAGQQPHVGD